MSEYYPSSKAKLTTGQVKQIKLKNMDDEHENVFIDKEYGFLVDMVEKLPEYLRVIKEVEDEVDKIVESLGQTRKMGSCHLFWSYKKDILKKKYNIN